MKFTLKDLVSKPGESFRYDYEFGDSWHHDVVLEEIVHSAQSWIGSMHYGQAACPPEDVGGVGGYKDFLDAIEDPLCEDRIEKLEWVGGDFDT